MAREGGLKRITTKGKEYGSAKVARKKGG